ncbi:GntR family transcriptional regulator [Aquincola tertiaricarbonis]|uniref:GntR family transcriptional regulator n=1 Tax=Aquincola tertiaricarbonis TaxID=391953 RepID=A0ABY4S557_AQUTE|nr:GntR family transcriptional regulator [Aquincola tertiaricarbonis]URI08566.1 GntR family transcriptional regulator [Aquincola tertiaricarbonis]
MNAPEAPLSINEKVYRTLRDQLMRGDIAAGQNLGIEELAAAMNTSTMPVRAALQRLAEQQAVQRTRSRSMQVPLLSLERLEDIRRCRVVVEGALTEWAVPLLDAPQIALLTQLARKIAQALRKPSTVEEGLVQNQRFHFTIYQAAESPAMLPLVESLWLQSGPYLRAARALMHRSRGHDLDFHDRILQAIVERDTAQARAVMEEDVAWAFDRLRETPGALLQAA